MSKNNYGKQIKELKTLKVKVVEFKNKSIIAPPASLRIPISLWNHSIINQYYKLRKELLNIDYIKSSSQKKLVLPINVWLLVKYVFETLFMILHLLLFTSYMVKVPSFKGMLAFYIGFFFFSYFILGYKVINYSEKVLRRILLIIKTLDEEMSGK